MKKNALLAILLVVASGAAAAQETSPAPLDVLPRSGLTWKEEWRMVAAASGSTGRAVRGAEYDPPELRKAKAIELIEDAVRRANPGELHARRPVSMEECVRLHAQLNEAGNPCTLREVQAAVDVIHSLQRENPAGSMQRKLVEFQLGRRPNLFGNVAEVAEARERGMVQTEDPQSKMYDLVAERAGGKRLQVKMYEDPFAGLDGVVDDVKWGPTRIRGGVMPREQLELLADAGVLRRRRINGVEFYETTQGPRVRLFPSAKFENIADAKEYCRAGQKMLGGNGVGTVAGAEMFIGAGAAGLGLLMLFETAPQFSRDVDALLENGATTGHVLAAGRSGSLVVSGAAFTVMGCSQVVSRTGMFASGASRLGSLSVWSGRIGVAGAVASEGIVLVQWWRGDISSRECVSVTVQNGMMWGGAVLGSKIGGLAGGAIGFLVFGPAGMVAGELIGEFFGGLAGGWLAAMLAEHATGAYFDFRDEQQERKLEEFLLGRYRTVAMEGTH